MSDTGSGEWPAWAEAIPEPVRAAVESVPVDIRPGPAEAMTEGWLGADRVVGAVRLVVAAWMTAVNGDDAAPGESAPGESAQGESAPRESAPRALAELALSDVGGDDDDGHDVAYNLLHPARKDWVIAPGPEVTGIELARLDLSGDVPRLSAEWRFTAYQRYGGPVIPPGWTGPGQGEYVGTAYLALDESRPFPWRMTDGRVETVDEYYGYTYTVRDETPEEYRTRMGAAGPLASTGLPASRGLPASAAALVPSGAYRLLASFAEHDHKFGGDASADVASDVPLTRDEARRLAEDAIEAEARRRMASIYPSDGAETEVRPSLNTLRVIRLLDLAPPVEPAAGPDGTVVDGTAVDDFARRYAASRGLTYPDRREPAWRDPGPWFLSTLDISRSHGLMAGSVADSTSGEVWYAEDAVRGRGGSRERWIVARFVMPRASRAGAIAVAVRRKRGLAHGGPPPGMTETPRGLPEVPAGSVAFGRRYVVAAAGGDPYHGDRSWADRLLGADFTTWLLDQPYGDRGAEATCFQLQGGLICVYAAGWPGTEESLDGFRERAARIASHVERATRYVVQ
jgi:hypothetical protein